MKIEMEEWTLGEALDIIRELQGQIWSECNYHLGLIGSVLNHGSSINDLDIVALPQENGSDTFSYKVLDIFEKRFGSWTLANGTEYENDLKQVYKFQIGNRRIDLFLY